MSKMFIYEPAMCCATGLCGVSVDPELLRISTVLSSLKKNGIEVVRFNLSNAPQEFIKNGSVNKMISVEGVGALPITFLDGKIVKKGSYPTNDELIHLLNVPQSYLGSTESKKVKLTPIQSNSGRGNKGDCC